LKAAHLIIICFEIIFALFVAAVGTIWTLELRRLSKEIQTIAEDQISQPCRHPVIAYVTTSSIFYIK
jgi:hypothetical protein